MQVKKRKFYLFFLCVLLLTGCSEKELSEGYTSEIQLDVEGLNRTSSRSAVDVWDETQVSVGYLFTPVTAFTQSLTVTVPTNAGEHISTGLEYPIDGTAVSFVGYHPVVSPNAVGEVSYDISKGDADVMMSNIVSGTSLLPINTSLNFKHLLTRIRFSMQCKAGESYPEPVNGISVVANAAFTTEKLKTYITLNLSAGSETFKIPGTVFNGSAEGVPVPQDLGGVVEPLVFDVMLQPEIPLLFKVVTLTDEKLITLSNGSSELWQQLTETSGGIAGSQYTVKLEFSGEKVLAQDISVTAWQGKTTVKDGGTWW